MTVKIVSLSVPATRFIVSPDFSTLPTIVDTAQTLNTAGTHTFTATGGQQPYVWSMQASPSGGSIDPVTGIYTAGDFGGGGLLSAVVDTIRVTDASSIQTTVAATVLAARPSDVTWTGIFDMSGRSESDGTALPAISNTGTGGGTWTPAGTPVVKTGILGGKRVARFNGTTDFVTGPGAGTLMSTTAYTILVVGTSNATNAASSDATASNDPCLVGDANGALGLYVSNTAGKLWRAFVSASSLNSATPALGVASAGLITFAGGVFSFQVGTAGTPQSVGSIPSLSGASAWRLAKSFGAPTPCDIGLMLTAAQSLTTSQKNRTFNYVQSIWGASL